MKNFEFKLNEEKEDQIELTLRDSSTDVKFHFILTQKELFDLYCLLDDFLEEKRNK